MNTQCKRCRHFKFINGYKISSGLPNEFGDCRRNAPLVSVHGQTLWPSVHLDNGCGQFEPTDEEMEFV